MPRLGSPKLLMKRAVPPSFAALAVGDDCPARRRCGRGCHAGDRDVEPVAAVGSGGGIDGAGAGGEGAPGGYESFGKGVALFEVGEDDDVVRYSGRGALGGDLECISRALHCAVKGTPLFGFSSLLNSSPSTSYSLALFLCYHLS